MLLIWLKISDGNIRNFAKECIECFLNARLEIISPHCAVSAKLCYCTTIQYTADSEKLRTFSLFSESEALNSAAASQRNPEKSGLIGYYLFGPNEPWSDMCSLSLRSLANAKSSSSRTRAEPERARARDLSLETHLTTDLLRGRSLTTLTKFCPLLTTYQPLLLT